MGYLPRVFFFNTFELGAESGNQVFSKEALRSTVSSRSPLTTLGTLEVPEDDSTCKSLLVELVVVVKQHMPWDGLNGGRTRCWWIRERGTS
jgi:hypothetical protein